MDNTIHQNNLKGTFAYLDNLLVCGLTKEEHDVYLGKFLEIAKQHNFTFNKVKCEYSKSSVNFLGYTISDGTLRLDPERLHPLKELKLPGNAAPLRRCLDYFLYYSQWLPRFSERIRTLIKSTTFPLSSEAIDEQSPFVVETDVLDHGIAATLNQSDRPVAFFSHTLSPSKRRHGY